MKKLLPKKCQVNVVEKDLDKLRNFEDIAEKKYSDNILTGFNIIKMKDGTYFWQAFFTDKERCNELFKLAKSQFDKVNQDNVSPFEYAELGMAKNFFTGGAKNYRN